MKKVDVGYVFSEGRCLLMSLLVFCPLVSFALSTEKVDIEKNVQTIERRLENYRDKLDFETKMAATALVRYGDTCVEPVFEFTTGKEHESQRRTIGVDILFGVNSDTSRAAIVKLFSANYVVLTNDFPSIERLNSPFVVFEESARAEYNGYMFAYYIAREAVLRDSIVAKRLIALVSEKDAVCAALRDAYSILYGSGASLPQELSLQTNANYVVSFLPFISKVSQRISCDEGLFEEFRRWYLDVLGSSALDLTDFALLISAIEQSDGDYFFGDEHLGKLRSHLEKTGRKRFSDLLGTKKERHDDRGKGGVQ